MMNGKKFKKLVAELDDPKAVLRAMTVRMVQSGSTVAYAAKVAGVDERSVRNWIESWDREGPAGLSHKSGAGRPHKISYAKTIRRAKFLRDRNNLTPKKLLKWIKKKFGVSMSLCQVRRILKIFGFRRTRSSHKYDYASSQAECAKWQKKNIPWILGMKSRGFRIVEVDECTVVNASRDGRKLWTDAGAPVIEAKSGTRKRTCLFGALADDGSQMFVQMMWINARAFVAYLRMLRAKYGKVVVIMDSAPAHTARMTDRYVKSTGGDVVLCRLPPGAPHLNAVEECWRQCKHEIVTSVYYSRMSRLRHAVSGFLRCRRFGLDIFKYLNRSI